MNYELFYLVGISKEADLEKIKQAAKEIVTAEGGVFEEKEVVEKRKLAYAVKHENYGIYVAQRFQIEDPEKIQAINGKINLNSDILRFIISRADELPELKTKEERIKQQKDLADRITPKTETKPEKKSAEKPKSAKPETKEEKKADAEDIDKKLEEILNI